MAIENTGQVGRSVTLEGNSAPSEAVVRAIAQVKGVDPLELPALYESVDPEALDELFKGYGFRYIRFSFSGYTVLVESTGRIIVQNGEASQEEQYDMDGRDIQDNRH